MDKKFIALMILFVVVFGVFVTTTLFSKSFSGFARASAASDPSAQTSLIFAWPLTAKVGNKVEVNIFVRSASNAPLDKKQVKLTTNFGSINGSSESIAESDKAGKVSFVLTSDMAGVSELSAFVGSNVPLTQKVTVKFE